MSQSLLVLIFALLWSVSNGAWAQTEFRYDEESEGQFRYAVSLFEVGKYSEAVQLFDSLGHRKPIHQRTTAASVMEAKSLLHLQQYDRSATILESLLAEYPYTSYRADIQYTLAVDCAMEHRYSDAARLLTRAMESTKDSILGRHIEGSLVDMADNHLDGIALNRLRVQARDADLIDLLTLKTAEKYIQGNNAAEAHALIDERLKENHQGRFRGALLKVFSQDIRPAGLTIGAALPLMIQTEGDDVAAIAREMLDGMNFALNEFASTSPSVAHVTLDVRDTGRDSVLAARSVQELSSSRDVVCIIGPLFSNLVAACTPIANREHVSLISPTATANGLAASGEYVFQMHPDFATRGKVMARYAVHEMGYQTLATLASTDPTGAAVAESFSREAERLGARVVASESFPRQANDIRQQCMSIRRFALDAHPTISFAKMPSRTEMDKFLKAGVDRREIDSLVTAGANIPATKLLGPRGVQIADSLHIKLSSPETDSEDLNVAVTSVDAIFVALDDAEEIGMIGPQLNYFNIKAELLGNNEWYDPGQLDAQRQYVNGVVFASDTYADEHNPAYGDVVRSYRSAGGKLPTKYTLIGYDVVKLVLSQVAGGHGGRESLRDALSKVREYKGIHSSITLSNGRVNASMYILKYSRGEVQKIGESTLSE